MSTISEFLTADHRSADELFDTATRAADRGDWAVCRKDFDEFVRTLKHHMAMEEQVLFPAFEEATGITAGPTRVMRLEHRQMLTLLEGIDAAINARDGASFGPSARSFAAIMAQHSAKEENVLYPMCDQALHGLSGEELAARVGSQ